MTQPVDITLDEVKQMALENWLLRRRLEQAEAAIAELTKQLSSGKEGAPDADPSGR